MLGRRQRKGTPVHCWWECKLVEPFWENSLKVPQKMKPELSYDSVIELLCIHLKRIEVSRLRNLHFDFLFIAALLIAEWKEPKCSLPAVRKMHTQHRHTCMCAHSHMHVCIHPPTHAWIVFSHKMKLSFITIQIDLVCKEAEWCKPAEVESRVVLHGGWALRL